MKKPQTTKAKPEAATKADQAATPKTAETAPALKKAEAAPPAEKKAKVVESTSPKQEAKASAPAKSAPKKAATTRTKKVESTAAKPEAPSPNLSIQERVGLTAGDIWKFLSENGATPVSGLAKALTEEEKIIQRSIGWLALEDKITISEVDRVETIALK
ncbi:MAG: winged helix-turn-helix domain-containing protein [Gammaproteobacteria bacterium]